VANTYAKGITNDLWWRMEDPQLFLVVKADFDGDGQEDVASLLWLCHTLKNYVAFCLL
jgi:hypothetical protein